MTAALASTPPSKAIGVYVHVPFCKRRCDFCVFSVAVGKHDLVEAYLDAVCTELGAARAAGTLELASTAYVGGGTPSQLLPSQLARLLGAIPIRPGGELTVECHPDDVTCELVGTMADGGVTRVSLGAQSLVENVRRGLGRDQQNGALERSVGLLDEGGIAEVSVDLIFGGFGESDADLAESLEAVLGLDRAPSQVSCYALSVEPGTALWADEARQPREDVLASRYELCDAVLAGAGYYWYEISNFARPGHECAHNQNYWRQGDYLGFGPSAHSHIDGTRSRNVFSLERYLERSASSSSPLASSETLTASDRALEALELSLRTPMGVPLDSVTDLEGVKDLLDTRNEVAVLNLAGRLLMDEVARRLVVPRRDSSDDSRQRLTHLDIDD